MDNDNKSTNYTRGRLVWTIGGLELDEASWQLRIQGQGIDIERKPMELLLALLHRAGEVVTKEELLDAAWPDVTVVPSSLPTAMAKLRKALGDQAHIIETVPGLGYRIVGEVALARVALPDRPHFDFAQGDIVPGAAAWLLERNVAPGDFDDVWLARSTRSATRIFKFARTPGRLRQLKREAAVGRLLAGTPEAARRFVLPIAQRLDGNPAWLAFDAAGTDLKRWFVQHGAALPLEARIALALQAARALAGAHAAGVLHGDIKPSNLLIEMRDGRPRLRIIDFGSSALLERSGAMLMGLTGLTMPSGMIGESASPAGTALYAAPELLAGAAPSVASDIYSLGLVLFQLAIGDLQRPLAPGWEALVADDILRGDIARAAALDPADRFTSAGEMADHLDRIEQRRNLAAEARADAEAQAALRRAAELAHARRPWIIVAAVILLLGIAAASTAAWQAVAERNEARRQTAIASAINAFLADDLLGRGDPSQSGEASETLIEATRAAEPEIDRRFREAPLVAARLYTTLARVFSQQSDWGGARAAYDKANEAYRRGNARASRPAIVARLQHAQMEALSAEKGSVERARAIIATEEKRLPPGPQRDPEVSVWLASAKGMAELAGGDVHVALDQFGKAASLADTMPDVFDQRTRNNFHQRHAFIFIRLGEGKHAEEALRPLLAAQTRLLGPTNPDVLLLRMNMGQAYLFQKRYADAVRELTAVLPLMRTRLGPDHRLVQQTLAARLEAFGGMGDYAESISDGRALYASSLKEQGIDAFRTIAALSDLATSECRTSERATGLADAQKAYRAALRTYGKPAPLTQGVGLAVAQCLIASARYGEARSYLTGIDVKAVSELASDPDWGANVELAQGQIAAHERRWSEAATHLKAARPALSGSDADVFQRRALQQLAALVQSHAPR